jgi:hypothetical protein
LPFVHRVLNRDFRCNRHDLPPRNIPTVIAVSNRIDEFGKLRANLRRWIFRPPVVFVLIAALAFPLALRQVTHVRR